MIVCHRAPSSLNAAMTNAATKDAAMTNAATKDAVMIQQGRSNDKRCNQKAT